MVEKNDVEQHDDDEEEEEGSTSSSIASPAPAADGYALWSESGECEDESEDESEGEGTWRSALVPRLGPLR